jgi:phospholipid-binding lipoprotein MlaA
MAAARRSEVDGVDNLLSRRVSLLPVLACLALLLGGCATSGNPKDPIEGFNRAMFGVNEGLDKVIFKPVATGYDVVLPSPVKTGVSNVFGNLDDAVIGVNNLLQGKGKAGFSDFGRVLLNSTVGIFGLFDVATVIGLEKHDEDFGQTFGRWGMGPGAYVYWPIFGPRNVRDSFGMFVDWYADPVVAVVSDVPARNIALALRFVSRRAQLLPADKVIEEAALDKYAYIRDGYLQRRRSLIHDGNPPREKEDF